MSQAQISIPLFAPVALLEEVLGAGLARGQVGTVVENLDDATALVEFTDDEGRAYAIAPLRLAALLLLLTAPLAA